MPDAEAFFFWGEEPPKGALTSLLQEGESWSATLVTPKGKREEVNGAKLPLLEAMAKLAVIPASEIERLPASFATWALATKFALDLVSGERAVPIIERVGDRVEARWAVAIVGDGDVANFAALAESMPPAAHAVPVAEGSAVYRPEAMLRAYLDIAADALLRDAQGPSKVSAKKSRSARKEATSWPERWQAALAGPDPSFVPEGFKERGLIEALEGWSAPLLDRGERLRACFRLELPMAEGAPFLLRFFLQSPDDPSLLVPASEVWEAKGRRLEKLGRAFRDPQEALLEALGRASRLFPPLAPSLSEARPESAQLDPQAAFAFLGEGGATLANAGFGVIVPGELTASGQRRLRLRMRVGGSAKQAAGAGDSSAGLSLDALLEVDWEAVLGDEAVSARELAALAKQKASLVRFRGAWVAIDPSELDEIRRRLTAGPSSMPARLAIQAALAGEVKQGALSTLVQATGDIDALIERLRGGGSKDLRAPSTLRATLRPYQERGLHWLATMSDLGLGACLADDMGLGKTMQILALLLYQREKRPRETRPALLVAPTSVVGNWEREIERFAPSLHVLRHYGGERARAAKDFRKRGGALVITTYGLLRRDAELLSKIDWSTVVLDEAQNIKNASSATAQAARHLRASHRFALTGTPVENRLAELWSILEFANPGLLGPLETFRRDFAWPIERHGNDEAAERLRRVVGPFLLRRLKSDPSVIQDLPEKNEMKVVCTLSREQATLYKAVVDEELVQIEGSEGITRRGRVLALLSFTKQICNHPAQYLGERGPLAKRSGKLTRITEMLEEAIASGDKALVFTQFREMGDKLVEHLRASLGVEALFLHGGTPKKARDEMVRRFQEEARGPRIFVLSVKAGGTGLNLTAASHVFHYDRWWNPAVEDQATDRAYRIGQTRAVQVHKLLSSGTVEEKIDELLEKKRALAAKIIGTGEQWITELDGDELRDLFALSESGIGDDDEPEERRPRAASRPATKPRKSRGREEVRS